MSHQDDLTGRPRDEHGNPEPNPLVNLIFQLQHIMMRTGDRMAQPHGLTASRWMLLCAIGKAEEPQTIAEVSECILLSPQNVSRMAAAMEDEGLIERFSKPGAGRAVFVRLTEAGQVANERMHTIGERFMAKFLEGFEPARVETLVSDLGELLENMSRIEAALQADPNALETNEEAVA
ncbi:MAG: MarR family transcriptional regulator [Planctomycetota bacterium]